MPFAHGFPKLPVLYAYRSEPYCKKIKTFRVRLEKTSPPKRAEDVTGEIKVNSIVEGISFSDVLNSIIKLCNIVYEKFCPDVGSFPFL